MLFPHCKFTVFIPHGSVYAGQRMSGTLQIESEKAIPRAEQIDLVYTASAWAGYGSGKNRNVLRRDLFRAPFSVPLPSRVLDAGTHRFPFTIDFPPWLPPPLKGNDCGITHLIETRLEVAWAIDPKAVLAPILVMAPSEGRHEPLILRTPPGFHEEIVLEVTLASAVFAADEALTGEIALRSGRDARFDAVVVKLFNQATIGMGRRDQREGGGFEFRLPAEAFRSGAPVPFSFPPHSGLVPTFRNAFIDSDVVLKVSVDIPWKSDPTMLRGLQMLPAGSRMLGQSAIAPVGSARLRQSAALMASLTGFGEGNPPVLVEGSIGPVMARIVDSPRDGKIGLDTELTFPPLGVSIAFRPRGILEGFRESPLLPKALGDKYLLRCKPEESAPPVADEALAAFFGILLKGLENTEELSLSDRHLRAHFTLVDDDGERMKQIARFVQKRAEALRDAIANLPFPAACADQMPAWRAVANEQGGFLVPTGPALHHLTFGARMSDGEARTIDAAVRTAWTKEGPVTRIEIGLANAPVPETAWGDFEGEQPSGLARAVLQAFPIAHVFQSGAKLERTGFTADPRDLFPGIEAFLAWVLAARGERRADAPYR